MKKHIPNAITCLNLFTGCVAVYIIFQASPGNTSSLEFAAYLVGLAAVLDFLDGLVARALHAYSEIGKQLDSLADMVSFGVVPGAILFKLMQKSALADPSTTLVEAEIMPFAAFLIIIFSALRLAKFNIDTRQTTSFIGVPTPANTLLIASLPLILANDQFQLSGIILNYYLLLGLTVFMSFMLVAEIPLFALKFKSLSWKDNAKPIILLLLVLPLLFILKFAAIPVIIALYVLLSLIPISKTNNI
jgi:CDP-diacylglycerol---serine O-phosphatidyltransferase